jgi:NTP pyrophosphatase (non-canonical NTP hydrolase)
MSELELSPKPDLAEWQAFVRRLVDERHFTKDPNEVFIRFAEEVGELAKEMRKKWKLGAAASATAAGELADVFMYLCDLANHFGVDLEQAVRSKHEANSGRVWKF